MQNTLKLFIFILLALALSIISCKPSRISDVGIDKNQNAQKLTDTVIMQSDDGDYQIIIIEPGFYGGLHSIARPSGYYSQNFLESRNRLLVQEYNLRVQQPLTCNPNLYEMPIE